MIRWYAIYTKPRHEKKVYELLIGRELEAYLPLVKTVRMWKDRKKKVEMPLFSSYVFVHIDYKDRYDVLTVNGVVKIVNFKGVPAAIPDWQIDGLKRMVEHPEKMRLENYIRPGELVEVTDGPFKGMRGSVKNLQGEFRLIVTIEGIAQSVSVAIDNDFIKRINTEVEKQ